MSEATVIGVIAGALGAGAALAAVALTIHGGLGLTAARVAITIVVCVRV